MWPQARNRSSAHFYPLLHLSSSSSSSVLLRTRLFTTFLDLASSLFLDLTHRAVKEESWKMTERNKIESWSQKETRDHFGWSRFRLLPFLPSVVLPFLKTISFSIPISEQTVKDISLGLGYEKQSRDWWLSLPSFCPSSFSIPHLGRGKWEKRTSTRLVRSFQVLSKLLSILNGRRRK